MHRKIVLALGHWFVFTLCRIFADATDKSFYPKAKANFKTEVRGPYKIVSFENFLQVLLSSIKRNIKIFRVI